MEPIGVALNRKSDGLFWEAVTQSLQNEPDIALFKVTNETEMETFLHSDDSRVLITEQSLNLAGNHFNYQHYTEANPNLAIIAIDDTGLETFIRLNDLGRELLLKLVRAILAQKPSEEVNRDKTNKQVTFLRAADVIKLVPKTTLSDKPLAQTQLLYGNWQVVYQWLDICFHLCLAENLPNENNSEVSVPGWAMSAAKARTIIGGKYVNSNEKALLEEREAIESQLITKELSTTNGELSQLARLYQAFNLTNIEKKILILVLAVELDGRYAQVLGYLNDDLTRRRPTPTLLKQLLQKNKISILELRRIIAGKSNLANFQLIREVPGDVQPASEMSLSIAPEIVRYLMAGPDGTCADDLYLQFKAAKTPPCNNFHDPTEENVRSKLAQWREDLSSHSPLSLMQLLGTYEIEDWFVELCRQCGEHIAVFDISLLANLDTQGIREIFLGVVRTVCLYDTVLLVKGFSSIPLKEHERLVSECLSQFHPRMIRLACHFSQPYITSNEQEVWYIERSLPSYGNTKALWQASADALDMLLEERDLNVLATALRFKPAQINAVLNTVKNNGSAVNAATILQAAKPFRHISVPTSVRRIEASFSWQDIVLPPVVLNLLRDIPGHVRESGRVLDDWGYRARMPYGHGVAALFSGPSGTGKTMAAQIIASELGVELFQVDLAKTISKYIGETEKNLDAVFDAAEQAGAVLLFDEADALFGKRTEVRDAHDRYANVEVAYLLQRMEIYSGLAILTTNLRQNLDKAFMRRLRFVVDFPMPSMQERESIWQASFPPDAPLGGDVNFKFLARRLELTGGNIQQIAIRSAFAAAAENGTIQMHHIVNATCGELRKLGMNNAEKTLAEFMPEARCAGL